VKNEGVSGARITIDGKEVATDALHMLLVDSEMDLPDMAVITLNNTKEYGYSHDTPFGATVEVEIGETTEEAKSVFKGEVVALEPSWRDAGESQVTVRAFNRLHRLTRGKKSRTFVKMTDKDIVSKVASDWGLSAECKGDITTKYDHIYQHNQSDFEFLKARASRINYELRVDDTKLFFSQRKPEGDEIELKWGAK
jgi:phage protein D